jgi:hypothetical protein
MKVKTWKNLTQAKKREALSAEYDTFKLQDLIIDELNKILEDSEDFDENSDIFDIFEEYIGYEAAIYYEDLKEIREIIENEGINPYEKVKDIGLEKLDLYNVINTAIYLMLQEAIISLDNINIKDL